METNYIDIVLDGQDGTPYYTFVEIENDKGGSIEIGQWVKRDDGHWVIRIQKGELQ